MNKVIFLYLFFTSIILPQELILLYDGTGLEPETINYETRVLTDGGIVVDIEAVNNAILDAKVNGYYDSLSFWGAYNYGVKKNANNKVTKLYDLSPNNNDATQSDTAHSPTWYADSLYFHGTAGGDWDYLDLGTSVPNNTIVCVASWQENTYLGRIVSDDFGSDGMYSYAGDLRYLWSGTSFVAKTLSSGFFIASTVSSTTDGFYSYNGDDSNTGDARSNLGQITSIGWTTGQDLQGWLGSINEIIVLSSQTQPPVVRTFLNNKYSIY